MTTERSNMIPTKQTPRVDRSCRFGRFAVCLVVGLLISAFAIDCSVWGDEPSPANQQVDRQPAKKRRKSRARRPQQTRATKDTSNAVATDDAVIRMRLVGSFELDFGSGKIIRGEGSTTIELDPADINKLFAELDQPTGDGATARSNWMQMILTLPQTVETTAEILK
ncbi:MAG: hypothetical protein KDB00_01360, partial [Planctomycetales bacterium]|nr:hypothetical protein [Planctomycetales bacterium]